MSNAVVAIQNQSWTPEQMKLITDVVAKGATKDELALFLYRCQNMGLDPLKPGQIHFVKYNASSAGTIVVGIEGFRSIAHRSGKFSGIKRGVNRDEKGNIISAWAEVYRSDWQQSAREEVPMSEYNTGRGPWQKMPETMLKKVAEAAALRMAFPNELGGVYEKAEMDQAEANDLPNIRPENPPAGEFQEPTEWRFTFGKWKMRTIEQVYRDEGPDKLAGYITWLESMAKKNGQGLSPAVQDAISQIENFLGAMENGGAEVNNVGE